MTDLSPQFRARLERLTKSQRERLTTALERVAAQGIDLDLDENDFDIILDEIVAPTDFEIVEVLTAAELSALVRAQAFADLSQEVDARTHALITARREAVIATFDLADIVARIDRRREWKEADPDPFEDGYQP